MGAHPSGFYAWCVQPESKLAKEDKRLLDHIKQSWLESGEVDGYRKVSVDLRDLGDRCGINRVHQIMRSAGLCSQTGYGKRKWKLIRRVTFPYLQIPAELSAQAF